MNSNVPPTRRHPRLSPLACAAALAFAGCSVPPAAPTATSAGAPTAFQRLEQAVKDHPGDVRARQLLSLAHLLEGRHEEARKLWDAPPAPNDEFASFLRTYLAHAAGDDRRAADDLERLREGWLRAALRAGGDGAADIRRGLIALYIIRGRHADAERLLADVNDPKDEVLEVLRAHLQKALGDPEGAAAALAEIGRRWETAQPLRLRPPVLCRRVDQFRLHEPFEKNYQFTPGEGPVLYAEIEHFTQESKGFGRRRVWLEYRLQLIDARGKVVPTPDWEGYNRRIDRTYQGPVRDLHLPILVYLPESLGPGRHTLRLRVEDKLANNRSAEAEVNFQVRDGGRGVGK